LLINSALEKGDRTKSFSSWQRQLCLPSVLFSFPGAPHRPPSNRDTMEKPTVQTFTSTVTRWRGKMPKKESLEKQQKSNDLLRGT
jgi:hypothetical protein